MGAVLVHGSGLGVPARIVNKSDRWFFCALLAGLLAVGLCLGAQPSPPADAALARASWIWGDTNSSQCELRRVLVLDQRPRSASIFITADNGYELFVNGTAVGSDVGVDGDVWQTVERYDVTALLARGKNVIGIRGLDLGGIRGVVAAAQINFTNAPPIELVTDATWRAGAESEPNDYSHPEFVEPAGWQDAQIIGPLGMRPWGKVAWNSSTTRKPKAAHNLTLAKPGKDFVWPEQIAFIGDDCSVYVPLRGDAWGVAFRVRDWSRAYTEFDLPCPSKIGRKLYSLRPGTNAKPKLLCDAGFGAIGSPSASFDGKSLLVAMAREGEKFFHIYRVPANGAAPQRLTDGPFHDIDPSELPDGRIVFTSTRIGTFEEYHQPPSRALFVMNADGGNIRSITHTLIFDNEPKVMADGRIVFIRTDNFFDRGKVETHLHAIRPDGTDGRTEVGTDVGPDYGVRLRVLGYGSPSPMPDGRLAFISNHGNFIASAGSGERNHHRLPDPLADLAPLPDGRLLATVLRGSGRQTESDVIAVIDPRDNAVVPIYETRGKSMHSPVFLGSRSRPPILPDYTATSDSGSTAKTGFLLCQDARFTKKTKADWRSIKNIRVLAAKPLTIRSSHSHIVHVGHETVELGTVPLAPDGSFFVEVPADTPLALQAVDAEGRSELNEMSWLYVRPGERRSCIGCHEPREAAPPSGRNALALRAPAVKLLGQGDPHHSRGNNPGVTGMMDLQFERFRECASLNRHNSAKADATGRDEVGELIRTLRSPQLAADVKISAAQRAAIFRSHLAAPALIQQLRNSDRELRLAAAVALANCGTRDSIPGLLDAMEDFDPVVARAAANAVVNLIGGGIADFRAFTPVAQRRVEVAAWRAWFKKYDWDAIERTLIPRLKTPSLDPPRRAIVALGHIGGERGAAALREFVSEEAARNPYPRFERDNRTDTFTYSFESPLNPRTLQEAVRALGQLRDTNAVPLLAGILSSNIEPRTANLYLAESCIEALGRIGTREAESALIETGAKLKEYHEYVGWYSDHPALYACHSSPIHARLIEALDAIGSTRAASLVPALIRSVPTDPDRGLFAFNDDYETLVGRVIRRQGLGGDVIESCLAILGDTAARTNAEIAKAIFATHAAWGGKPGPENRAAQILSLTCRDSAQEPRVRAAFERFVAMPEEPIKRELGNPTWTPVRHWTLFYLARSLGNLRDARSFDALASVLGDKLNEARHGRPDPATPEIHFLQNEYTPCWRAPAAWALGRIGDHRAAPVLIRAVSNLENATDVRHAAAEALGSTADLTHLPELRKLAANYPEVSTRRALLATCEALESTQQTKAVARAASHE